MSRIKSASGSASYEANVAPIALLEKYNIWVRGGATRGRDGVAPSALAIDLEETLQRVSSALLQGDHRFTTYKGVLVQKGVGAAPRLISVATARDRIVMRALHDALVEVFPECSGVIPQLRVQQVASVLGREGVLNGDVVRLDLRDFYPSIDHGTLFRSLDERVRHRPALTMLRRAVSTPTAIHGETRAQAQERHVAGRGVPQGLAISNILSEIVAQPVDDQLSALGDDVHVIRFVDDVLVFVPRGHGAAMYEIAQEAFASRGLSVHDQGVGGKSYVRSAAEEFDFLGYTFRPGVISVRAASVRKIEERLARAARECALAASLSGGEDTLRKRQALWDLGLAVTGCVFQHEARGWLAYFRQMNDLTMLKHLDWLLEKLIERHALRSAYGSLLAPRSFLRAYHSMRRSRGERRKYVPHYDDLTPQEMRTFAENVGLASGLALSKMSDLVVESFFFETISRRVKALERDIGQVS